MNTNKQRLMAVALRAGILTATLGGTLHAQSVIDGSANITMGGTGRINNAPHITFPNGTTVTWEATTSLQGFMVPAAQLTGLASDGSFVDYEDLIPIKTSKLSVMVGAPGAPPTGTGTVIDGNGIETNGLSILDSVTNTSVPLTVENGVLMVDGQSAGGQTESVALTSSTEPAGSSVGEIVYNTDPNSGLPEGLVYWNGSEWQSLAPSNGQPNTAPFAIGETRSAMIQIPYQDFQVNTTGVSKTRMNGKLVTNVTTIANKSASEVAGSTANFIVVNGLRMDCLTHDTNYVKPVLYNGTSESVSYTFVSDAGSNKLDGANCAIAAGAYSIAIDGDDIVFCTEGNSEMEDVSVVFPDGQWYRLLWHVSRDATTVSVRMSAQRLF